MKRSKDHSVWFVTGSQHLYGPETLRQVAEHSREMAEFFSDSLSCNVIFKPVVKTTDEITQVCMDASADPSCIGVITWMHTFSPSKMWITGLRLLAKPLLHLHTQYNRDIPFAAIDMDFMNLNQSAHGDREHGYIGARLRLKRKVVAGHWQDPTVLRRMDDWMKAAIGAAASRAVKVARFGDNMREVAVTEGDKVEAQLRFGWSVNTYGIGDLAQQINNIPEAAVDSLMAEYAKWYTMGSDLLQNVRVQARFELAMKTFLEEGGFSAFTTTFEDLSGLEQLPGLAVQRLMEAGYGFGAEGDWKTAALVHIFKAMSDNNRTSFMEDYTYHLEPGNELVLGAHMLEICPTLAASRPTIEVHPLGIGGKADPARLVFSGCEGKAVCASLVDMGDRFRLIVNEVVAVKPPQEMPNLPVARMMWQPLPSLTTAAEAWIYAGGAHHTAMSFAVTSDQLRDLAEILGIEYLQIDGKTDIDSFRQQLIYNEMAWR